MAKLKADSSVILMARHSESGIMAKIVQALTRASKEYDANNCCQSLVRDLDAVINKLNTSFQQELKQEVDAQVFLY